MYIYKPYRPNGGRRFPALLFLHTAGEIIQSHELVNLYLRSLHDSHRVAPLPPQAKSTISPVSRDHRPMGRRPSEAMM